MRVALVCPYSVSVPGGVQGQALGLAAALRRVGVDAVVLAPVDDGTDALGAVADLVVPVGRSLPVPANGSVARLALGPRTMARTVRALARLVPDVVHLHEPLAPGPTWAALLRGRAPLVGTFHRAGTPRGAWVLRPLARAAAGRLSARVAVSAEARATAEALAPGEYRVIGNGVELDRFAAATPWPTGAPTILFIGRHEPRKGLGVLLDAFARLAPELGAQLWVAGEGPDTSVLRQRWRDLPRVAWLGRISDEELASRLAGADVFCAPALGGESFGIVLVEAMAAGTAVVASDIPGYAAVARDHAALVPPGDAPALAEALDATLAWATGDAGAAGGRLRDAAEHAGQWSMEGVARQYLAIYETLGGAR